MISFEIDTLSTIFLPVCRDVDVVVAAEGDDLLVLELRLHLDLVHVRRLRAIGQELLKEQLSIKITLYSLIKGSIMLLHALRKITQV